MKLNIKRTVFTGFAFLAISAFWQIYDGIVPKMLTNTFGLGETLTGAIMAIDNVLALFLLPFFGALSDRTKTRIGKRMPFILCGSAVSIVFLLLIPVADLMQNLPFFMVTLAVVLIAMASYRSPAVALMPDLTPKPLRSKGNAIINLMGTAGGIITLLMIKFLVPAAVEGVQPDYRPLFIALSIVMAGAIVVLFFTIKENRYAEEAEKVNQELGTDEGLTEVHDEKTVMKKDVRRSMIFLLLSVALWYMAYNALTTAFSRYAEKVWGLTDGSFADALLVATVTAVFSFVPLGIVSSKIGRKKTILYGVLVITLCYFAGCWFTEMNWGVYVLFGLTGIAWAAINVNSYPMVVEMSKGSDVGKYTGLYYTFSMAAQTITPILSGFFLEHFSYRTLFPYAVIFSLGSLITMLLVRHGDSKPVPRGSVLESFDVDD